MNLNDYGKWTHIIDCEVVHFQSNYSILVKMDEHFVSGWLDLAEDMVGVSWSSPTRVFAHIIHGKITVASKNYHFVA